MHSSGTESNELNITLEHHNHMYPSSQGHHHQINPPTNIISPTGAAPSFGDFHDAHRQHFVHPGMLQQPPGKKKEY